MGVPRFHQDAPLRPGERLVLGPVASRHVQVLRLQPGAEIAIFDGRGTELSARVEQMGRREVSVQLGAPRAVLAEPSVEASLAVVVPANDRMDFVVEKATELGVTRIWPLMSQRSVWRLDAGRATQRRAHWQAVAAAACEQCGRAVVPLIEAPQPLAAWISRPELPATRWILLTSHPGSTETAISPGRRAELALSGPEGGFTADEEALARSHGFRARSLGPRVLRADTAPLAWLAHLMLSIDGAA